MKESWTFRKLKNSLCKNDFTQAAVKVTGVCVNKRQNSEEEVCAYLPPILSIGQFGPEEKAVAIYGRKGLDLFLLLVPPPQTTEQEVQGPHSPTSQSTKK